MTQGTFCLFGIAFKLMCNLQFRSRVVLSQGQGLHCNDSHTCIRSAAQEQ